MKVSVIRKLISLILISSLFVAEGALATTELGAQDRITISGNALLKDGKPFVVKGVIFEGFVEPVSWLKECTNKKPPNWAYCERHLESRDYYNGTGLFAGKDALSLALKNWNVNSIRFNVAQDALAPSSRSYDPEYVKELQALVARARDKGLVVFIALFSGANRNAPSMLRDRYPVQPLPTEITRQATLTLGKVFGNDEAVVIELLNEPWPPASRQVGYKLWLDGGVLNNRKSPYHGVMFVGMEKIVQDLRAASAKNAVVVQGLHMTLEFVPRPIRDPLNKIIYAVHPFFKDEPQGPELWDMTFGNFAQEHPVVITAWQAKASGKWCAVDGLGVPSKFLKYIHDRKIGLIVYAFDIPQTVTKDFTKYFDAPSPLGEKCSTWGRVGELVQEYYRVN